MVSLVDIVPQTRTVQIAAGELELHGLGLRQIASLLLQFPSLRNLLTEGAPAVEVDGLLSLAPDAISTIIAEGARQPNAIDAIADGIVTLDEALDCLAAIIELTFPRGVRPLLEKLARAGLVAGPLPAGKVPDTSGPPTQSNSSPPDMMAAE